jgi:cold shock CspA family protein
MEHGIRIGAEYDGECTRWMDSYGFLSVRVGSALVDFVVFVSARDLKNASRLEPGDRVRFVARQDGRGRWQASHCTRVTADTPGNSYHNITRIASPRRPQRVETIIRDGRHIVMPREI